MGIPSSDAGGIATFVVEALLILGGIAVVALRIWAVKLRNRPFKIHDYLAFAALPFCIALSVCEIIAAALGGSGQHLKDVTNLEEKLVIDLKAFVAASFVWLTGTCLVKLSFLTLLFEIFSTPRFQKACAGVMILIGLWFIALILNYCLICQPFEKNFYSNLPGHCGNSTKSLIAQAASCLVMDAIITVLPMPQLWKLQMPLRKKLGIALLFGLSAGVCVVNALRIAYTSAGPQADFTYIFEIEGIMACFEVYLGLLITCIPTFQPVIAKLTGNPEWKYINGASKMTGSTQGTNLTNQVQPAMPTKNRTTLDHDEEYLLDDNLKDRQSTRTFAQGSRQPTLLPQDSFLTIPSDGAQVNVQTEVSVYTSKADDSDATRA